MFDHFLKFDRTILFHLSDLKIEKQKKTITVQKSAVFAGEKIQIYFKEYFIRFSEYFINCYLMAIEFLLILVYRVF